MFAVWGKAARHDALHYDRMWQHACPNGLPNNLRTRRHRSFRLQAVAP
jgi:hypothetical protein